MFTIVLLLVLLLLHLRLLPGALLQVLVLAGGEGELDGGHGDWWPLLRRRRSITGPLYQLTVWTLDTLYCDKISTLCCTLAGVSDNSLRSRHQIQTCFHNIFYNDSTTMKMDTSALHNVCWILEFWTILIIDRHIVKCLVGMLLLHEVVENVSEQNLVARDLAVQERHLYCGVDTV